VVASFRFLFLVSLPFFVIPLVRVFPFSCSFGFLLVALVALSCLCIAIYFARFSLFCRLGFIGSYVFRSLLMVVYLSFFSFCRILLLICATFA